MPTLGVYETAAPEEAYTIARGGFTDIYPGWSSCVQSADAERIRR